MIPFNFIYCRPDTFKEAVEAFARLQAQGKAVVYYGGGSELITMCRAGSICPDAVIDIKNIPLCNEMFLDKQALHIGSACTLHQIGQAAFFPLLGLSCGRIADHTNQCRITLGGNLCGTIIYRETALPLLLADAEITIYAPRGKRTVSIQNVFHGRMELNPGECIGQIHVPAWALSARHFHIKKTTNEKIDYPLVSIAAICRGNQLRVGFSGICAYPFRSREIEELLNDSAKSIETRAEEAIHLLPAPVLTDVEGGRDFRVFTLKNMLAALLEEWQNGMV